MAKSEKKNAGQEKDALGRTKKEEAEAMTPGKIREFSAIFREPERKLLELAKTMEDLEVDEIMSLTQGIYSGLERIEGLILTQFAHKIEKAAFRSGKRDRRKFGK